MPRRAYGQFCGLSRALELVGERWSLLIVRDLLVGPKRFTDLHRGLCGIPTNVLTARLKELEQAGIVRRRILPRPATSIVYELTQYGAELEEPVVYLGRWGAKSLGEPRPEEIATPDSLVMALRSTFRREAARGLHAGFELRFGATILHARIDDGELQAGEGELPGADLTVEAGTALKALMAAEITPKAAVANGSVRVSGNAKLLQRFVELFRIDPMPVEAR